MVRIYRLINKAVCFLLYMISGIKIPPAMHSPLANPKTPPQLSQPPPFHPLTPAPHNELPQAPILQSDDQMEARSLCALACFSLDNLILHFERDQLSQYYQLGQPDSNEFFMEESSFLPISYPHDYTPAQSASNTHLQSHPAGQVTHSQPREGGRGESRQIRGGEEGGEGGSSYLSWSSLEQEFQSGHIGETNEKSPSLQTLRPRCSPCSSKNVTKNLGKLLFKFIWKNRHHLPRMLGLPVADCQAVVEQVQEWKKDNNITREYLLSKWHSPQPTAKLFRMLSHHFFRQSCLPALFRSRIALKRTHLDRIHKFRQAVANPRGLDSLN